MNPAWQTFMQQQGAQGTAQQHSYFAASTQEVQSAANGDVLIDLSHLALIRAQGEDCQTFLQGQFSNDIHQVDAEHSQLSAYCTPKGRMLALFRIWQRQQAYHLFLPLELHDTTLQRLRMYVMRAKVEFSDAGETLAWFGFAGPEAETKLTGALGSAPAAVDGVSEHDGISIIRVADRHARFIVVATPQVLQGLWEQLRPGSECVGTAAWEWLDIMAGVPNVVPQTVEAFVPQMANLELLGGVNFKKGCYPGQEIVARMHYLGRLKQRMYRAHSNDEPAPQAGDPVYAPDFANQSAGTVVAAQPAPMGGYDLLAVMQISSADNGIVHLQHADGPRLQLQPLPYELPPVETKQK